MSFDDLPEKVKKVKFYCLKCRQVVDKYFMSQSNNVCNRCYKKQNTIVSKLKSGKKIVNGEFV